MPTLNQAGFINAAINSVLGQDYPAIELIVADGGSTDGTLELLKNRQALDSRLRWFSQPDNGPAEAINNALSKARGTIIGWLNSDDLYAPGAITRAVNCLQLNTELLMVYGQGQQVNDEGKYLSDYPTLPPSTPVKQFLDGGFICQPTVFFRRTLPLLLGQLDESLKTAFDFDYWLRAFSTFQARIGFVNEVQAYSRLHEDCITLRRRRTFVLEGMQLLAKYLGHAPKEWLLTYVEELLTLNVQNDVGLSKRADVTAAFVIVSEWLTLEDKTYLIRHLNNDDRLDACQPMSPIDNAKMAMDEFLAGAITVSSTPSMLTLETTSRCNLRCVMCPHAINAVNRPKHLEEEMVNKLNRFIIQAESIQLHGIGEPTSSPAFWKMLDLLPSASLCESSINTNLTLLDAERLEKLLNSNLKIINVSLDAAQADTYQKIRGFSFEKVLANLEKLLLARNNSGKHFPLVYLNMTLMRFNIEELPDFIRLGARLGVDRIFLWHLNRWSESEMARYVVKREDWTFDYQKEGLWNFPALSNRFIRDAESLAKELGVQIHLDHNKTIYFADESIIT
jgi:glycosyltransferase involved in cell wall biosynthesis/organic radical activating enzyme